MIPLFSFLLSVTVNSTQLKTLITNLQKSLSPSSISSILQAAAGVGESEAKRLVPVNTGALQSSIYSEVRGNNTIALGASEEYGPYIEYGTSNQNAQPFIEPAALTTISVLEQTLSDILSSSPSSGGNTKSGSSKSKSGGGGSKPKNSSPRKHKWVSRKKGTNGKWVYDYGGQRSTRNRRY